MLNRAAPTFDDLYVPFPIRFSNALFRHLDRGVSWPSLDAADLLEAAERRTGLRDWDEKSAGGGEEFRSALTVLTECLEREGRLTLFGRVALRQFLLKHLANRLRVVDTLERFPEIHAVEIRQPVFIVGWYRTGTTLLHNLLAELPHLRAPLFWELRSPCPPGAADPRRHDVGPLIREVHRARRIHRYLAPHFDTAHPMMAEMPEECLHLFENACISATSFFISEMKSFAWWLLERDLRPAYRFFRAQLQLLQWLRPVHRPLGSATLVPLRGNEGGQQRRWVLKWPYHLWHLDALLEVFPDARIVHAHRDPLEAVPSVCSLAAISRSPMCEEIDARALGRFWFDYCAAGLERGAAARREAGPGQMCDVRHDELMRDPVGTVERLHDELGLALPAGSAARVEHYLAANPRHKHGVHRYGLDQFGLTQGEVRERYGSYWDRLLDETGVGQPAGPRSSGGA